MLSRYGSTPAIVLDITDAGARIEHFTRLDVGRKARFRLDWQNTTIEVEAMVVACRIHRFSHGDDGATVYQSGLFFSEYVGDAQNQLREFVAQHIARSLAEQVANARGIGPVMERNMPVFRSGVVSTQSVDDATRKMIPNAEVVVHRGYVRCTLNGNQWEKKWSRTPEQPENGFTVLASEPADHVDQLCDVYLKATAESRALIKHLARVSVEKTEETPEPR